MWLPIYRTPLVFTDKSKGCFGWFFNVRVSLRDFIYFFFSLHKGIFTKCKWSDQTIKPCLLNKLCITLHICSYVTSCVFTAQVNTSACLKYFFFLCTSFTARQPACDTTAHTLHGWWLAPLLHVLRVSVWVPSLGSPGFLPQLKKKTTCIRGKHGALSHRSASANCCLSVFLCDKLATCQGCNPAFAHWQLGQAPAPPCDPECSRGGCRKWMNERFIPLEFGVRLSQSDWLWINLIKWKFIQSRSMFYLWFPPMSLRTRGFCAMNLKNYKKGIQVAYQAKNMDTVSRECNKVWPKSWLRNKHCWVHAKHCIIGGRAPLNAVKLQMPLWAVNVCIVVIAVIGGDVVWTAIWKYIPIV